jgi:hypothetical protein
MSLHISAASRSIIPTIIRHNRTKITSNASYSDKASPINFNHHGFNTIRHPKVNALELSQFVLPNVDMSAETHSQILNAQPTFKFDQRDQIDTDQTGKTYNSKNMFLGRETIKLPDGTIQTRRYLVKVNPLSKGFLSARETASVYVGVDMGIARHEAKTNVTIVKDKTQSLAVLTRQFYIGVDGEHVLDNPKAFPDTYVSNRELANLVLVDSFIRCNADMANPGNMIMAHNTSKVVGELSSNPLDRRPTAVIIDGERCFPNNQLMMECVVPATQMDWAPGMPFIASLEWRQDRSRALSKETFIERQLMSNDPALRLLVDRLGIDKAAAFEFQTQDIKRMINALPTSLSYLKYFQVYTEAELNRPNLPIKTAIRALYEHYQTGKPLTLAHVLSGDLGK